MFLLGMVQQNAVAIFTCRQRRTSDIGRWFSSFWSASHRSNHGSSSWCCMETLWDISTTKFLGSTAIVNGGSNLDLLKTIVDAGSLHNQNVSSPWSSNKFFPMIQKVVLLLFFGVIFQLPAWYQPPMRLWLQVGKTELWWVWIGFVVRSLVGILPGLPEVRLGSSMCCKDDAERAWIPTYFE